MNLVIVIIMEISKSTWNSLRFSNSLLFSLFSGNFGTASLRMIGGDGVVRPYGDNRVMAITALRLPVWRCREKIDLTLLLFLAIASLRAPQTNSRQKSGFSAVGTGSRPMLK